MTSSSPGARCAPRSTRSSSTAGRRASSSRCSSTAATASCRSAPTTSARTCRRRSPSASTCACAELDGTDEVTIGAGGRGGAGVRHLLSIEDLDRDAIERILALAANFARGRRPPDQEGALAARPPRDQPLLRGLDAHAQLVRARRQAALRRRAQPRLQRLERREGRVAARHRRDAVRLRPGRDRDPLAARRRAARWSRAGRTPRSSTPATASTSTRRRRCSTATRCAAARLARRARRSGSSATSLHSRVARSCIQAFTHARGAGHGRRARRRSSPTSSPRSARASATRSTSCARPTSSTRCGCSSSG